MERAEWRVGGGIVGRMYIKDAFRSSKIGTLATAAFDRAIFGKGKLEQTAPTQNKVVSLQDLAWGAVEPEQVTVRFQVFAPRIEAGHKVWCMGSAKVRAPFSLVVDVA
jgi:hypothetical protein